MNSIEQLQIIGELGGKIAKENCSFVKELLEQDLVIEAGLDDLGRAMLSLTQKAIQLVHDADRKEIPSTYNLPSPQPGTLDYLKWFIYQNQLEDRFLVLTKEEQNKDAQPNSEVLELDFIPKSLWARRLSQKSSYLRLLKMYSRLILEEDQGTYKVSKQRWDETEPNILNKTFEGWQEPYLLEVEYSNGFHLTFQVYKREVRELFSQAQPHGEAEFSKHIQDFATRHGSFKMFTSKVSK